jgi:hypothetical protein
MPIQTISIAVVVCMAWTALLGFEVLRAMVLAPEDVT